MAFNIKKFDVKNFYEWPIYGRAFVLFIIFLIVLYFGYFFDSSSLSDQIYARYKQEKDLKQQVRAIVKTEEGMKESVSEYRQLVNLFGQWQGQLISADHLPDLLHQMLKLGAANHVQFSSVSPGVRIKQGDYFKVPIKVVMQGDYNQVANFISEIANMSQIVSVGDFTISKESAPPGATEAAIGDNRLTGELNLEVFYLANQK